MDRGLTTGRENSRHKSGLHWSGPLLKPGLLLLLLLWERKTESDMARNPVLPVPIICCLWRCLMIEHGRQRHLGMEQNTRREGDLRLPPGKRSDITAASLEQHSHVNLHN